MADAIGVFTVTEIFDLTRPCVIAVDPASTGSVSVQIRANNGWATAGQISAGQVKKVNVEQMAIRVLVSGSVSYEVR